MSKRRYRLHFQGSQNDSKSSAFRILSTRLRGRKSAIAAVLFGLALSANAQITKANWGGVTTPVYNSSETVAGGAYSSAEFFAGPNKFGSYFAPGSWGTEESSRRQGAVFK